MKTLKNLSKLAFIGIAVCSMTLTSCKKKDEVKKSDNCTEVSKKYAAAATAYGQDPTNAEKCKAYKEIAEKYMDCIKSNKTAVEGVKKAIASLTCK